MDRLDSENRMVGNCMMCLAEHRRANTPLQCTKCLAWRPESFFAENKRHWGSTSNRVCVYVALRKELVKYVDVRKRRMRSHQTNGHMLHGRRALKANARLA